MTKNTTIVTGASGGLGREFVKLLVADNKIDEIWDIARNEEKLQWLVNEYGNKVKPYSMDLSDIERIKEFQKVISDAGVNVVCLSNNAGFAKFCSYGD